MAAKKFVYVTHADAGADHADKASPAAIAWLMLRPWFSPFLEVF